MKKEQLETSMPASGIMSLSDSKDDEILVAAGIRKEPLPEKYMRKPEREKKALFNDAGWE